MKPLITKHQNKSGKLFKQKFARLELYYEFEKNYTSMKDIPRIQKVQDAIDMFANFIISKQINLDTQEKYLVAYLNRQSRVLSVQVVTIGIISSVLVDCRTIIKTALDTGATSIILAHNHPSGEVEPSNIDLKSTEHLKAQLMFFEIIVFDHFIFSPSLDVVYSFESMKVFKPNI